MKKIIFFGTPAYGHMISAAPAIKRLVESGINVVWLTSKKYRFIVEKAGAVFEEYKINLDNLNLENVTSDFFELFKNLVEINQQLYFLYKDYDFGESFILYDSMVSFAKNIAGKRNIKSICFVTTMAYNFFVFITTNLFRSSILLYIKNVRKICALIKKEKLFRKKEKLPAFNMLDLFVNSGDRTIVFTPKEIQPMVNTFNKSFYFVGTTIKDRLQFSKTDFFMPCDYYISLGSIFTENQKALETIINFSELKNKTLVITAGKIKMENGSPNINLVEFTNQQKMLGNCKYFINHGGLNSICESIYYGVPQLCFPMQQEQKMSALIVQKKRVGIYMKKLDNKYLIKIKNKAYTKNLERMSAIIRSYDASQLVLNIINNYFFNSENT